MIFETSIRGSGVGFMGSAQIVLVGVSRDDISMLISSFRETNETTLEDDELFRRVGAASADLLAAIRRLFEIARAVDRAPRSLSLHRFAITPGDRQALAEVSDSDRPEFVTTGRSNSVCRIITTVDAIATSLRCARAMLDYLWVEEIHALTGYELDELRRFERSLQVCIASARSFRDE